MTSLTRFIFQLKRLGKGDRIEFLALELHLNEYLEKVSNSINEELKMNWFCTFEKKFLYRFLFYQAVYGKISNSLIIRLAYKLSTCLGRNSMKELNFLIDKILFNGKFFAVNNLNPFKKAYLAYYKIKITELNHRNAVNKWSKSLLPVEWPYKVMSMFYERNQNKLKFKVKLEDFDIIQTTLYYTSELEIYIKILSPTNKLIFLMMPFFSKAFLETDVKEILKLSIKKFFEENCNTIFDFENTTVSSEYA